MTTVDVHPVESRMSPDREYQGHHPEVWRARVVCDGTGKVAGFFVKPLD
jgi:hypothetical protein